MQEVAPNAVNTAVAIDAIICTTNLKVSFFVIVFCIFMEFKEYKTNALANRIRYCPATPCNSLSPQIFNVSLGFAAFTKAIAD